ncbi:MAG: hypothetical protein ACRDIU_08200 [Actinomycetota bacterium]
MKGIARWLGAGAVAGFAGGLVIGGVGGRLAMFVMRLTSDPSLVGTKTDDDFLIGRFTGDTGFLVGICAAAGMAGGLIYVLIRWVLPSSNRAVVASVLSALVGGSIVVHADGIDFKVLSPRWLAVVMFVALPGLYGAATSALAEKLGSGQSRIVPWASLLILFALPPVIGIGTETPLVALALLLVVLLVAASTRFPAIARVATSTPATWTARAALAGIGLWTGFLLFRDVSEILFSTT